MGDPARLPIDGRQKGESLAPGGIGGQQLLTAVIAG